MSPAPYAAELRAAREACSTAQRAEQHHAAISTLERMLQDSPNATVRTDVEARIQTLKGSWPELEEPVLAAIAALAQTRQASIERLKALQDAQREALQLPEHQALATRRRELLAAHHELEHMTMPLRVKLAQVSGALQAVEKLTAMVAERPHIAPHLAQTIEALLEPLPEPCRPEDWQDLASLEHALRVQTEEISAAQSEGTQALERVKNELEQEFG